MVTAASSIQGSSQAGRYSLNQHYDILLGQPLPDFNTPNALAFLAQHKKAPELPLFALICDFNIPTRYNLLDPMSRLQTSKMLIPLSWGTVVWHEGGRRFAIVFPLATGGRLVPFSAPTFPPVAEKFIIESILPALISALNTLHLANLVHGSVHPSNIFYTDDAKTSVLLGEAVSAPCGYHQPAVCESVTRVCADPIAKGEATTADDLYALGVTVLLLSQGGLVVKDQPPPLAATPFSAEADNLLLQRMERGNYATLSNRELLPHPISDRFAQLLRGLLADHSKERWTIGDVNSWLNGKRPNAQQPTSPRRANTTIHLHHREYATTRSFAWALSRYWDTAFDTLSKSDLSGWFRRSFMDNDKADSVARVFKKSLEHAQYSRSQQDRFVCELCIMLDPPAPIRLRSVQAMPDGLGGLLAYWIMKNRNLEDFYEVIKHKIPLVWIDEQSDLTEEKKNIIQKQFDFLRYHLGRTAMGEGIERCLYHLNPGLPCLSPLVINECVLDPKDLLPAVEKNTVGLEDIPLFDNHIASFLAERSTLITGVDLANLHPNNAGESALTKLKIYAHLQKLHPAPVPKLAEKFRTELTPAVKIYRNSRYRKWLLEELGKVTKEGDLQRLYALVGDPQKRHEDLARFKTAAYEYQVLVKKIYEIHETYIKTKKEPRKLAHKITMMICMSIGSVWLLYILMNQMIERFLKG